MDKTKTHVTQLLPGVAAGEAGAIEALWRLVYDELRSIAKRLMAREGRRDDLQTTVVAHEAYIKLVGNDWAAVPANRGYFFAAAARAMRQFLVENARRRNSDKRGGGVPTAELLHDAPMLGRDPTTVLAIEEALEKLAECDPQALQVVQCRFHGGLTGEETAEALGISPRQVDKIWQHARAWLAQQLA